MGVGRSRVVGEGELLVLAERLVRHEIVALHDCAGVHLYRRVELGVIAVLRLATDFAQDVVDAHVLAVCDTDAATQVELVPDLRTGPNHGRVGAEALRQTTGAEGCARGRDRVARRINNVVALPVHEARHAEGEAAAVWFGLDDPVVGLDVDQRVEKAEVLLKRQNRAPKQPFDREPLEARGDGRVGQCLLDRVDHIDEVVRHDRALTHLLDPDTAITGEQIVVSAREGKVIDDADWNRRRSGDELRFRRERIADQTDVASRWKRCAEAGALGKRIRIVGGIS